MKVALLYPPPWKIPAPGEPAYASDGPPAELVVAADVFHEAMHADEMGEHLAVGLRKENVALLGEAVFVFEIVLDDAVVYQRQFAGCVEMRVRVGIGWFSVGGPAGMADAGGAVDGPAVDEVREVVDAPRAFAHLDVIAVEEAESGRIIAPVFQAPESLEQEFGGLAVARVCEDATHR